MLRRFCLANDSDLSESAKDNIRSRIASTVQSASIPHNNLTKDQQQALKRLKNDDNIIVILPADKGRVTVVMDKMHLLATNRLTKNLNATRRQHFYVNSTAKYLRLRRLTLLTLLSRRKLQSTENFIDAIKTVQIPDDYKLVSFEVKSLFTSISLQLALQCTETAIQQSTVELPLPTADIMDLLNL